jgi:poly(3-hydroxybutyrate) depolymerase
MEVVIDFHPLGGSGSTWNGSTGWGALADSKGFIMIWPDGIQGSLPQRPRPRRGVASQNWLKKFQTS